MKDLTHRHPIAYLSGCLKGDAWLTSHLGLRVADKDFADAFAYAVKKSFGVVKTPCLTEGKYWVFRCSNKGDRFSILKKFQAFTDDEKRSWILGWFDSEGNASLIKRKYGLNSYERRISMYSTDFGTITLANDILHSLGMPSVVRERKPTRGHLGTKTVYEIALRPSKNSYAIFASTIGSNIKRKQCVINLIVESYQSDLSQCRRSNQLLGAKAKHEKTISVTLPFVLIEIRKLIDSGIKPTVRICCLIKGFNTVRIYFPQAELIRLAKEIIPLKP